MERTRFLTERLGGRVATMVLRGTLPFSIPTVLLLCVLNENRVEMLTFLCVFPIPGHNPALAILSPPPFFSGPTSRALQRWWPGSGLLLSSLGVDVLST